MAMICCLVEAYTVRTRCGSEAARFFIGVELQIVDQSTGMIIEAAEPIGGRLL